MVAAELYVAISGRRRGVASTYPNGMGEAGPVWPDDWLVEAPAG